MFTTEALKSSADFAEEASKHCLLHVYKSSADFTEEASKQMPLYYMATYSTINQVNTLRFLMHCASLGRVV